MAYTDSEREAWGWRFRLRWYYKHPIVEKLLWLTVIILAFILFLISPESVIP